MTRQINIIFLTLAAAVFLPAAAGAQIKYAPEAEKMLREDLSRAAVNLNSYEFDDVVDTPAPKGYKPFYISHYGRHGSRSDSRVRQYGLLASTLSRCQEAGLLTPDGEAVLKEAEELLAAHNGMDGRLTDRGKREHAAIAARMYERYPSVLRGKKKVRSESSTVPRCLISQTCFTNSLISKNPRLEVIPDTGEKFMDYIGFTGDEASTLKVRQICNSLLEDYRNTGYDTLSFAAAIFKDANVAKDLAPDFKALQNAAFDVAAIVEDFDIEDHIFPLLPFDFVYFRWSLCNRDIYLRHCNSKEAGAIRIPAARMCVDDIIAKADEAISGGGYAADLRFGHDLPLLGLVSYMGLEGVGGIWDVNEVDGHWLGFREISMASNLQIIFYRNRKGDVLVKFLYQEKEHRIMGLEPVSGPYYRWEDVKNRFIQGIHPYRQESLR